jgi:2-iminobutanoate/2-iminopropanoate deaminase
MRNLSEILDAAQSGLDLLLQVTVYTSDIALWDRINAVYARILGEHRPARVVVPTAALHFGCLIEIAAIAAQRAPLEPGR